MPPSFPTRRSSDLGAAFAFHHHLRITRAAAMSDEDDFTPRLGKPRNAGGRKARTYLQRVLQARTLAGGARRITRAFTGSRIARGNVAGRQLDRKSTRLNSSH